MDYERRRFERSIPSEADVLQALPKTAAWLRNVFQTVGSKSAEHVGTNMRMVSPSEHED